MGKRKCFVVMGFGKKTDFEQQKTFDLDKTYRIIIKKAVEAAGLECIRADDVVHAGVIDKPMYELLLEADAVVADLSTSNANAIYELGVRHALRPHTTIVIAEKNFKFPFDLNHVVIRPYNHLGEGIDAEDAEEARAELTKALKKLAGSQDTDSPVYTFLDLTPPVPASSTVGEDASAGEPDKDVAQTPADQSVSVLWEMFQQARAAENWSGAKLPLQQLRDRLPGDPYVIQQLSLATYKGKKPDVLTALDDAKTLLNELGPHQSNDPETLGLWGAIHKRLWEEKSERADLDESLRSYEKGFHLKDDYYNGINYAFMLDVRASVSDGAETIADRIWARRVRRRVIEICDKRIAHGVKNDEGMDDLHELFWLRATKIEALVGIGEDTEASRLKSDAVKQAPETWMAGSLEEQLAKLQQLQADAGG